MSKKRIMHLIHDDGAGGGPVVIRNLLNYFKSDYEQTFVHGGNGNVAKFCEEEGIAHHRIPLAKKILIPLGLLSLITILLRKRPDLIFLHGQWAGPVGAIAGWIARVKSIVYIIHFPSFYTDWDIVRVIRNRIVEAVPCRLAHRIITTSEGNYYQYLFRKLITPQKAEIIHNAVSPDNLPNEEDVRSVRQEFGWNSDTCHVASLSRLSDQKCTEWLLESWRIVNEKEPEAHLWIVNDGPEEDRLKQRAAELELKNCTFLGAQPGGMRFLAAADIIAMTSMYEGHANLPLEAMINSKPIVASDVDGVRDSFTDEQEGYLVAPGDTVRFADRLIKLIQTPSLRAEMGACGKEHSARFHPDKIYEQYRKLIDQLFLEKE